MQVQAHPVQQTWISYAITIGIVVVVMALRMRRMGKMRPLKLETLWVVPVLYLGVAALMFWSLPPTGWVAIASMVALLVGAVIGWQRGKMMHIHVDPQTHALNQKASAAAMFFLIALIIIRSGARAILGNSDAGSPAMLTDPLIPLDLGLFSLPRRELYQHAQKLLGEVRARS